MSAQYRAHRGRCRPRIHRKESCDLQGSETCRVQHDTCVVIVRKVLEEHRTLQNLNASFVPLSCTAAPKSHDWLRWNAASPERKTNPAPRDGARDPERNRQPRAGYKPWAHFENPFEESGERARRSQSLLVKLGLLGSQRTVNRARGAYW